MAAFQFSAGTVFRGDHFNSFTHPDQLVADTIAVLAPDGSMVLRMIERFSDPVVTYSTIESIGSLFTVPNGQPIYPSEGGFYLVNDVVCSFNLFDWTSGAPVLVGVLTDVVMSFQLLELPVYAPGTNTVVGYTYVTYVSSPPPVFSGDLTATFGTGDDVVTHYGSGDMVATLGDGNDTAYLFEPTQNAPFAHLIYGGRGNDVVQVQSGNGTFYGGQGNDAFGLNGNNDGVWETNGGAGLDTIYANDRSTIVESAGSGNDTYIGSVTTTGGTTLSYAKATSAIVVDLLNSGTVTSAATGVDTVSGIGRVIGSSAGDTMFGTSHGIGPGLVRGMTLDGRGGNDSLTGGDSGDSLIGGNDNDVLAGGSGNDTLRGDAGDDDLQGGAGRDFLTGGTGADAFIYTDRSESANAAQAFDRISDFVQGEDVIDLSAIDARTSVPDDQAFVFVDTAAISGIGQVRYAQSGGSTYVYVNIDGSRAPEMRIELTGLFALTVDDFIL